MISPIKNNFLSEKYIEKKLPGPLNFKIIFSCIASNKSNNWLDNFSAR